MLRVSQNKGFTLVELAIVLVIIGIILGAVIKGQDLIDNARAKKFASEIKAWEIAVWNFFDRKGRLPGDPNKNGIINDAQENSNPYDDIDKAKFQNPPNWSFNLGGAQFYVLLGSSGTVNYLIVCKNDTCSDQFNTSTPQDHSAIMFFESFDAYIDGTADASQGSVRKLTNVSNVTGNKRTFRGLSLSATSAWFPATPGDAGLGLAMILR